MLRRLKERFAIWYSGRCPAGGAHDWRVTKDLVYGQEMLCGQCDEAGWMDYGR